MNHSKEKYCKKGNHYVNVFLFSKRSDTPDGLNNICSNCKKEQKRILQLNKKQGTIKAF